MNTAPDDPFQAYFEQQLRRVLERQAAQQEFYQQAANYLAVRRVVQDLEELHEASLPRWRHVHPARLVGRVRLWLRGAPRDGQHAEADDAAVIIDGEVVSRSADAAASSDNPPIVIVIPPSDSATDNDISGSRRR